MTTGRYLSEYINRYLDIELRTSQNLAQESQNSYGDALVMFLAFLSARLGCDACEIKTKSVDYRSCYDFMVETSKGNLWGPSTWNNRLAGLRSFFRFLSSEDLRFLEVYRKLKLIKNQRLKRRDRFFLNQAQLEEIFANSTRRSWVEYRDYTMVQFMIKTGLRAMEVRNLKHEDILYLSSHTIHVRIDGKGRKERVIPIVDPQFIKTLKSFFGDQEVNSEFCFSSRSGCRMSMSNLSDRVIRFCSHTKLKKQVTPHVLRHSAAMNWLRQGVDVFTISALLGHEDLKTTQIYVKSTLEDRERKLRGVAFDDNSYGRPKLGQKDQNFIDSLRRKLRKNRR